MFQAPIILALAVSAVFLLIAALAVAHLYVVAHSATRYAKPKAMREAHMALGMWLAALVLVPSIATLAVCAGVVMGGAA